MSLKIKLGDLEDTERALIVKKLKFEKKRTNYNKFQTLPTIRPYLIETSQQDEIDYIYLPLYWSQKYFKRFKRPDRNLFPKMKTSFKGKLRPLQVEVQKEAISLLNKKGTAIISLYTGGGKTITSIYLAAKIKLPTLIIVHRLILIKQWKESILKVCPTSTIQVLTAKSELNVNADFYIMNAINVSKKVMGFFWTVGTLIADEVHVMATEKMAQAFYYVQPRYCIGLSATPYRSDGMDSLLHSYFGEKKVFRKLYREHIVFKVKTEFEPSFSLGVNGKLDWNSVIQSQTCSDERNELIVKIVKFFKDRNFLILSKRVNQVNYLHRRLQEEGEDVTSLVGVKKFFNYESRILIATSQKAGVGFDHPKLDTLLIASDLEEYFIQYLGRVFRTEDGIPFIFDLVDNFKVLLNHYYTRRRVYIDHGGKVVNFTLKKVKEHYNVDKEKEQKFNNMFILDQISH